MLYPIGISAGCVPGQRCGRTGTGKGPDFAEVLTQAASMEPGGTLQLEQKTGADEAKLAGAARQFESLLIAQMLKSARESSSGGWMGSDGDSTGLSPLELAEGHLAETLANAGGLGLSKLMLNKLAIVPSRP